jgi:microcystin-dependent protein
MELGEKGSPEQVNITPNEGRMYQTQAPYCGINFIICLYGIFPPRN